MLPDIFQLIKKLDSLDYVVEEELATILLLMLKLKKPLLLEGPPGVGKTEASKIIASHLKTKLIRLQCYEGLDVNSAVYDCNDQKQLLCINSFSHYSPLLVVSKITASILPVSLLYFIAIVPKSSSIVSIGYFL